MDKISAETRQFIKEHCKDDVRQLALQARKYPNVDMNEAVTQISGHQIAEKKIPSWANTDGILYPKHLSMEQCSSELTALYKATLASGDTFADLTAGFGVDCSFIARNFKHAHYVERQEYLCEIARNNFETLGLNHIEVHNIDGVTFLEKMDKADCIFLDPARRDANGGKTVLISECEPDVSSLEETLVEKADKVMIKLSPMLDIFSTIRELKFINNIHIISVNNECKELILILKKSINSYKSKEKNITISCEQIVNNFSTQHLDFTLEEERDSICTLTDNIQEYIYEPGAALLKAGAYKILSERYKVDKLHPNSHLYTSDKLIDFPGRKFKVIATSSFNKKEIKSLLENVDKANLTVRNFPSTVAELRKKLKLKEGGETYIFATTLNNGEKVLIKCQKA